MGPEGMREIGETILKRRTYAEEKLSQIPGVCTPKLTGPRFKEFVVNFDDTGKTVAQISVRWVLEKGVSCALLGARRPDQLDFIPGCVGFSLTKEQCDEMEAIVAKHVPVQVGKDFLAPPLRED